MGHTDFSIEGMTFDGCASEIRTSPESLADGVRADGSFSTGSAHVDTVNVSKDPLQNAIEANGFQVNSENDARFSNKSPDRRSESGDREATFMLCGLS